MTITIYGARVRNDVVEIGNRPLSIEDVLDLAAGAKAVLSDDGAWRERIAAGASFLQRQWEESETVYGVTTGSPASFQALMPPSMSATSVNPSSRMISIV